MKLLRSILLLAIVSVYIPVQYAANELTSETLNFETLLTLMQSDDTTAREALLNDKKLQHQTAVLISDHLIELIQHETINMELWLRSFFDIISNEEKSKDKCLIRDSLLQLGNFKQLNFYLNDNFCKNNLAPLFIEYFFVFPQDDYDIQDLSDDHYNLIFLYKPAIDFGFYWRAKNLITRRVIEPSSSKRIRTLQWLEDHKSELDLDTICSITMQLDGDEAKSLLLYTSNKYSKSNNFLEKILIRVLTQKLSSSSSSQIDDDLQTLHEKHLVRNCNVEEAIFLISPYMRNLELSDLLRRINEKTQELQNDYYIFVHAQNIKFYPLQQWYTALRSLVEDRQIPRAYCYPWIVEPLKPEDRYEEIKYHEFLNKEGCCYSKSLFMNYALFANITAWGSSSAYYFFTNSNLYLLKTALEFLNDIFNVLGLNAIYEKYKTQFEKHGVTFDQLSEFGNMLLIAVPKVNVSQSVYVSYGDGTRKKLNIEGRGETDDISIIMETLEKSPEKIEDTDHIQFCLIMTQSPYGGGLNPESGIKIIPFNCIKPEKLQEFEQEKADLLALMHGDIEGLKKYNKYGTSK